MQSFLLAGSDLLFLDVHTNIHPLPLILFTVAEAHKYKVIFLACQEMFASVFYAVPCKVYSGFWCYGCSLFVLIVSEKLWIGVELVCVCSCVMCEAVLLKQQ